MRICILETDTPAEAMRAQHGDFADMFERWLSPAMHGVEWSRAAVFEGANLPEPGAYDGYMITGCRHGVYDDLPWIVPLVGFLQRLRDKRIPVGGVCFGHQVMAHAYGARVEKSAGGWVLGAETYEGRTAFAMHQDQVLSVPDGASSVTGSARCPIGRIGYGFPALSVQYHPEFTAAIMEDLLAQYGGTRIDKRLTDAAGQTLAQDLHVADIARDFAAIFQPAQELSDGS